MVLFSAPWIIILPCWDAFWKICIVPSSSSTLSQWLNAYRLTQKDIKTKDEFNHKYVFYLADGFEKQGLEFEDEEVIKYLDDKFMELIKYPNFKYKQIKVKYNTVCFYAVGISQELIDDIEEQIYQILKNNNNL